MDIKLPTNQRDQLLLFAVFAAVGAIVVFYMYVYQPKALQITGLSARVDSLTQQNEIARRDVARGTATQIREESERYGRILAAMRQLVPTANEVPTLIDQIVNSARRAGRDLEDIRPLGVIQGDVFDTHKWNMSIIGPYHSIAEFLTYVGSLTRIMTPMNVTILRAPAPAQEQGSARSSEVNLRASFEIQTYVARTGSASPSAGGSP
jgi:type IV pilus assembly protein PilO